MKNPPEYLISGDYRHNGYIGMASHLVTWRQPPTRTNSPTAL